MVGLSWRASIQLKRGPRFASIDPVPRGNENAYIYAHNPVNFAQSMVLMSRKSGMDPFCHSVYGSTPNRPHGVEDLVERAGWTDKLIQEVLGKVVGSRATTVYGVAIQVRGYAYENGTFFISTVVSLGN